MHTYFTFVALLFCFSLNADIEEENVWKHNRQELEKLGRKKRFWRDHHALNLKKQHTPKVTKSNQNIQKYMFESYKTVFWLNNFIFVF